MDAFEKAAWKTLKHEGVYSLDPQDPGGETKYGISKRAFPGVNIKNLTREQAVEIYRKHYWDAAHCAELPTRVQAMHFDTAVNCGVVNAIRILQRSIGVADDGLFGPMTRAEAQHASLVGYLLERLKYYDKIIARNPVLAKYRNGWTARAKSYVKS